MTRRSSRRLVLGVIASMALVSACQAKREAEPAPASAPAPEQKSAPLDQPTATPPTPPPQAGAAAQPSPPPSSATDEDQKPAKRDGLPKDSRGEPRTPEEAQAAFDRAKTELDTLLGTIGGPKRGAATPLASSDGRCPDACKAFSSLKRAADAVCRLTSETDPRCTRAKDVVKESQARVDACKCAPADG